MSRRTGYLWHPSFGKFDAGSSRIPHVEPYPAPDLPETRTRIDNLVRSSGMIERLVELDVQEAPLDVILGAHDPDYIRRLVDLSDGEGGEAGPYVFMPPGGLPIVRRAAGAAIKAVDAVLSGDVDNAYALVRPAGHHASRAGGMGFCLLNNVAIAALHAINHHGLERVAIIDWDVHHGNGTQEILWDDPRVLAISIHQSRLFTISDGGTEEIGGPAAEGSVMNVPLPAGSGHGAYLAAIDRVVPPAVERFQPQLLIIASGLDALYRDPLGRMMLHSDSFRQMTRRVLQLAERCDARLAVVHEGGYAPIIVPFGALAILEELSGQLSGVEDPFLVSARKIDGQDLSHDQDIAIQAAEANVERVQDHR